MVNQLRKMIKLIKHFDYGSLAVIGITLILFMLALVTKGFTRDVLLEAAIFLISVKLVIMAYKRVDATDILHKKLDDIYKAIKRIESHQMDRKE